MEAMKHYEVYEELIRITSTTEYQRYVIRTRWVPKETQYDVRAILVAQDYARQVDDKDDIYASTPSMTTLKQIYCAGATTQLGHANGRYQYCLSTCTTREDLPRTTTTRVLSR